MQNIDQTKADFRVGMMTFAAIALVVLGITFAGGEKGLLFQPTAQLEARLKDVGGLKKGSLVTMGGMAVGKVVSIRFCDKSSTYPIEVMMTMRQDMRDRIKTDSRPAVRTQGMLGDRYLEISMGSVEAAPLAPAEPLNGEGAADFDKTLEGMHATLAETTKMLTAINTQEGTAGQLIYNEALYKNLESLVMEIQSLIKDFREHPKKYVKLEMF